MSLSDRVDPGSDVLAELPLAIGLVGVLVAAFFLGSIVGAEAMAAGEPAFPPMLLPGVIWDGAATQQYLRVYQTTKTALWVCAGGVMAAVVASALVDR